MVFMIFLSLFSVGLSKSFSCMVFGYEIFEATIDGWITFSLLPSYETLSGLYQELCNDDEIVNHLDLLMISDSETYPPSN